MFGVLAITYGNLVLRHPQASAALSSWKSLWRTRRTSRIKRESRKILININEDLGVLGYLGSGMIPTEFNWSALDRFSNSGNLNGLGRWVNVVVYLGL